MTGGLAFPLAILAAPTLALAQVDAPMASGDAMPGMSPSGASTPQMSMPGTSAPGMSALASAPSQEASSAMATQPVGDAPPPAPPTRPYADDAFGAAAMAASRAAFQVENGGQSFSQVMINLAELQLGDRQPAYRWDAEAWYGGDLNRLTVKSEGDGGSRSGVGDADIQALYSRAVGPYFNLQAGARESFGAAAPQTYGVLGFEGVAPYWPQIEGALFLSTRGDLSGRLEAYDDQRITQRLVLQPRVEVNLVSGGGRTDRNDVDGSDAELGLRLRYEVRREIAPYIGVSWTHSLEHGAEAVKSAGYGQTGVVFVAGLRSFF